MYHHKAELSATAQMQFQKWTLNIWVGRHLRRLTVSPSAVNSVGSEIYLTRALRFCPARSWKPARMETVQQPGVNCSNTWFSSQ